MRRPLLIAVSLIVLCAAPAATARGTAKITAPQMRAYLKAVDQPYALFDINRLLVHTAVIGTTNGYDGTDKELLKAEGGMRLAIKRLSRAQAPGDLTVSQRDLLIALRLLAGSTHQLAITYRDNGDIEGAASDYDASEASTADAERSWGQEITVVLRRLQMAVPLWVKRVGR